MLKIFKCKHEKYIFLLEKIDNDKINYEILNFL